MTHRAAVHPLACLDVESPEWVVPQNADVYRYDICTVDDRDSEKSRHQTYTQHQ